MNLSKRGEYALRTLIRIGVAQTMGREVVSVTELAGAERLPLKFVEQILLQLRGAGYIDTRRGKFGGYRIAKPFAEIGMGEIIRFIDGRLAPLPCASETSYQRCTCPDEEHCGLRMLMIDVRNAIAGVLDRYSLGDVIDVTLQKIKRDGLPGPFGIAAPVLAGGLGAPAVLHANPRDGFLAFLSENLKGKD